MSDSMINSNKIFTADDFAPPYELISPQFAAAVANARIREILENCPTVYGRMTGINASDLWQSRKWPVDTHEAKLWDPKLINEDPE